MELFTCRQNTLLLFFPTVKVSFLKDSFCAYSGKFSLSEVWGVQLDLQC
ncbi:hypothetical protein GH733_009495 [Mirounga leonina]|nr:hypothetical protein GH733_009495 [Mirounga leonina]